MSEEKKEVKVEEDLEERIKGFNDKVGSLLGEFELGLAAQPIIMPDGRLAAKPIIISVRGKKTEEEIINPDA